MSQLEDLLNMVGGGMTQNYPQNLYGWADYRPAYENPYMLQLRQGESTHYHAPPRCSYCNVKTKAGATKCTEGCGAPL